MEAPQGEDLFSPAQKDPIGHGITNSFEAPLAPAMPRNPGGTSAHAVMLLLRYSDGLQCTHLTRRGSNADVPNVTLYGYWSFGSMKNTNFFKTSLAVG